MLNGFIQVKTADFHKQRRKKLLEEHPEIRGLVGYERKTKYIVTLLVFVQLTLAYTTQTLSLFWWGVSLYFGGATLNHILFTAIHEVTHHLAFRSKRANRWFAIFINLPLGIPAALSFEKYHMLHHRFMGVREKDTDIPFVAEARLFDSRLGKFLWLFFQPFTYTLRPLIKHPQKITGWEWLNIGVQSFFNVVLICFWGYKCFLFLLLSTFVSLCIHPLATHFIAEHYVVYADQESYSYYGLMNLITFNVGHHVEHHDFPSIPWSKISQLRKIAPEYYESLYSHDSWLGFMKHFIFSKDINLFSRIIRE